MIERTDEFIANLWTIVRVLKRQLLVIQFLGEVRVFLVESFSAKTRDVFFNEVRNARDITDIVSNLIYQISLDSPAAILDRIMVKDSKSFKFGHDNYMWLLSNEENR